MRKILFGALVTVASSALLLFQSQTDGLLHMYALDIGQGDAIFIRGPAGENILMDGGPGNTVMSELADVLPFFDRTIDVIILSHPHRDHLEGLISVIQKYPVGHVLITGAHIDSSLNDSFLKLLAKKQIPVVIADTNSDIQFEDGVLLDVLFPFYQIVGSHADINNTSIVVKVVFGENAILLAGDSEVPEEQELLAHEKSGEFSLRANVLKVAHHGSKTSSTEEFLNAVRPDIGIISVGQKNKYGHPSPPVIDRLNAHGIKIYRTDTQGRIEIVLSKEGIAYSSTER